MPRYPLITPTATSTIPVFKYFIPVHSHRGVHLVSKAPKHMAPRPSPLVNIIMMALNYRFDVGIMRPCLHISFISPRFLRDGRLGHVGLVVMLWPNFADVRAAGAKYIEAPRLASF